MGKATCSVDECGGPARTRGWCDKHYRRWRRHGDPLVILQPTAGERFWAKVDKSSRCWIWTGARSSTGYGNVWHGGRYRPAHRVAFELLIGPIPDGLHLDHLCRVRACVNPAHLEPVTCKENVRRGEQGVLKTHCPAGHPYDEANTRIVKGGYRQCRTCDRERARLLRDYQGLVYGGTHCRHGHEYTPENTRIYKGTRFCRACAREATRRYRAARLSLLHVR